MNIQEFLATKNVPFELIEHRDTFDAQHMAQAIHVSGHHVAKTVLLSADGGAKYVVAVLPATHRVDLEKAAETLAVGNVALATESELANCCPDCEVGALPPFGSQYNLSTVFDQSLDGDDKIVFEGTNHHESIRMNLNDYKELEKPVVGAFSA